MMNPRIASLAHRVATIIEGRHGVDWSRHLVAGVERDEAVAQALKEFGIAK